MEQSAPECIGRIITVHLAAALGIATTLMVTGYDAFGSSAGLGDQLVMALTGATILLSLIPGTAILAAACGIYAGQCVPEPAHATFAGAAGAAGGVFFGTLALVLLSVLILTGGAESASLSEVGVSIFAPVPGAAIAGGLAAAATSRRARRQDEPESPQADTPHHAAQAATPAPLEYATPAEPGPRPRRQYQGQHAAPLLIEAPDDEK